MGTSYSYLLRPRGAHGDLQVHHVIQKTALYGYLTSTIVETYHHVLLCSSLLFVFRISLRCGYSNEEKSGTPIFLLHSVFFSLFYCGVSYFDVSGSFSIEVVTSQLRKHPVLWLKMMLA